jgi:hypothetical protein
MPWSCPVGAASVAVLLVLHHYYQNLTNLETSFRVREDKLPESEDRRATLIRTGHSSPTLGQEEHP